MNQYIAPIWIVIFIFVALIVLFILSKLLIIRNKLKVINEYTRQIDELYNSGEAVREASEE